MRARSVSKRAAGRGRCSSRSGALAAPLRHPMTDCARGWMERLRCRRRRPATRGCDRGLLLLRTKASFFRASLRLGWLSVCERACACLRASRRYSLNGSRRMCVHLSNPPHQQQQQRERRKTLQRLQARKPQRVCTPVSNGATLKMERFLSVTIFLMLPGFCAAGTRAFHPPRLDGLRSFVRCDKPRLLSHSVKSLT